MIFIVIIYWFCKCKLFDFGKFDFYFKFVNQDKDFYISGLWGELNKMIYLLYIYKCII